MNHFLIANPDRCIGCRTCEIACVLAHAPSGAVARDGLPGNFTPRLRVVKTAAVSAPVQCRHCEDAPCANVCPTQAIVNREDSIQVDPARCIGCKSCVLACPFGAMDMVPLVAAGVRAVQPGLKVQGPNGLEDKDRFVALKCDLCAGRPEGPACAGVCPTQALSPAGGAVMTADITRKRAARAAQLSRLF